MGLFAPGNVGRRERGAKVSECVKLGINSLIFMCQLA
jgi:hypothetical protein